MKKPKENTQVTLTRCLKIDGKTYNSGRFLSQELPDIVYEKGYAIINEPLIPITPVLKVTEEKKSTINSSNNTDSQNISNTKKNTSKSTVV